MEKDYEAEAERLLADFRKELDQKAGGSFEALSEERRRQLLVREYCKVYDGKEEWHENLPDDGVAFIARGGEYVFVNSIVGSEQINVEYLKWLLSEGQRRKKWDARKQPLLLVYGLFGYYEHVVGQSCVDQKQIEVGFFTEWLAKYKAYTPLIRPQ